MEIYAYIYGANHTTSGLHGILRSPRLLKLLTHCTLASKIIVAPRNFGPRPLLHAGHILPSLQAYFCHRRRQTSCLGQAFPCIGRHTAVGQHSFVSWPSLTVSFGSNDDFIASFSLRIPTTVLGFLLKSLP